MLFKLMSALPNIKSTGYNLVIRELKGERLNAPGGYRLGNHNTICYCVFIPDDYALELLKNHMLVEVFARQEDLVKTGEAILNIKMEN